MKHYSLQYLIDNIIKGKYSQENQWININCLAEDLNMTNISFDDIDYEKNLDLRVYPIATHICTDTEVGLFAYFLNDECVCISRQVARKNPEEVIGWMSKELAEKTKKYIKSLLPKENEELDIEILDFEVDMEEGYYVEYTGQMTSHDVIYDNKLRKVIEDKNHGNTNFHNITIDIDGVNTIVDIRDCKTPYRINEFSDSFNR